MHPVLSEWLAREHRADLYRKADQWRQSHPKPPQPCPPTTRWQTVMRLLPLRSREIDAKALLPCT